MIQYSSEGASEGALRMEGQQLMIKWLLSLTACYQLCLQLFCQKGLLGCSHDMIKFEGLLR